MPSVALQPDTSAVALALAEEEVLDARVVELELVGVGVEVALCVCGVELAVADALFKCHFSVHI